MPALEDRLGTAAAEKRAIGRSAAALIQDGETVLLDGGTTTMEVARALLGRAVQVVTNSIPIASLMSSSRQADVVLIGGYVSPRTGVAMGPLATAMMKDIRVRRSILGAGGIVAEGVYNSNMMLVETERQMMACGQEVMIVADSSKFGRLSLSKLCELREIDTVVVDSGLSDEYRVVLKDAKVNVQIAPIDADGGESSTSPGHSRLTQGAARTEL
jgi:DeoR/GlpR family transcriptional regulator of sugar metabolism